jgi:glycogen(starch) synthase
VSLRILHVLDHSIPLHSGYAFRTVAILREQRARGWTTVQLTTPKQGPSAAREERVDGWTFHRTPLSAALARSRTPWALARQMTATARRIAELIESQAPHVVHAHSPVLAALPALWVARRSAIPMVYEVRALWEDAATDHGTTREGSPRYLASRWLETFAVRSADHVTTISEGLRCEIASRGVAPERITVIPNGVDVERFRLGEAADPGLRRSLGLEGRSVLGFAGSFYGYEGLDMLLDATARLLASDATVAVLLLGGGPQEEALKARAAALGLGSRVVFAGRVPHDDVARYYDLIDVLVYPRRSMRLTELVTPLKPLEAMAQGRIVIASDVGGHRELIRDGETGYLFRPGNVEALVEAIRRAFAHRGDWQRMRFAGRRFVETERTWRSSVAHYASVYGSLPVEAMARAEVV